MKEKKPLWYSLWVKETFRRFPIGQKPNMKTQRTGEGEKPPDVSVIPLQSALNEGDVGLWKNLCALGWGWSPAKLWAGWKNKFNFIESLLLAEHSAGFVSWFLCSTWRSALCPGLKEFLVQDLYFLAPFELVGGGKGGLFFRLKNYWQFFLMSLLSRHSKKTKLRSVSKFLDEKLYLGHLGLCHSSALLYSTAHFCEERLRVLK